MPLVKDKPAWQLMIMEHRLILLERVVAEFPDVLKTHRSTIAVWRARLKASSQTLAAPL